MDTAIWFDYERRHEAAEICGSCPVKDHCEDDAKDEVWGVWGGILPEVRVGVCSKPTKKFPDGRTGSAAGYLFHHRSKEDACTSCLEAHSIAAVERLKRVEEEKGKA